MPWLVSENLIGFEIIEYVEPQAQRRQDNFEYWKSGITHFCIIDPQIEELCKKITEHGESKEGISGKLFQTKDTKYRFVKIHSAIL
jgi:hypothetical protein